MRDAGPLLDQLNDLVRCDVTTRNEKKAARLSRRMDELEARIDELAAAEELAALRPELDGNEVMADPGLIGRRSQELPGLREVPDRTNASR